MPHRQGWRLGQWRQAHDKAGPVREAWLGHENQATVAFKDVMILSLWYSLLFTWLNRILWIWATLTVDGTFSWISWMYGWLKDNVVSSPCNYATFFFPQVKTQPRLHMEIVKLNTIASGHFALRCNHLEESYIKETLLPFFSSLSVSLSLIFAWANRAFFLISIWNERFRLLLNQEEHENKHEKIADWPRSFKGRRKVRGLDFQRCSPFLGPSARPTKWL